MELSKTEGQRILRSLELKAYRSVVDALRAQGTLTKNKHEVLKNLAAALKVDEERSRSEIRRAVNNNLLTSVAQCTNEINTESTWRAESVRKVPSTPMLAPQTVFTALADNISDIVAVYNRELPETSSSLNDLLDACTARTEANLARHRSSKTFEPLLSNRTFKEEAIRAQLEKIKLRNQYSHPNEYFVRVPESRVPPGAVPLAYKKPPAQNDTVFCNDRLNPPSVPPSEVNPTLSTNKADPVPCSTGANSRREPQPAVKARRARTNVAVQPENTPAWNASSRVRRAKLLGKRWNPRTHTLETLTFEDRNSHENSSRTKATSVQDSTDTRNGKRGLRTPRPKSPDRSAAEPEVEPADELNENTSPNKRTRKRIYGSRSRMRKSNKVCRSDSEEPKIVDNAAEINDPEKLQISDDAETNSEKLQASNRAVDKNICLQKSKLPDRIKNVPENRHSHRRKSETVELIDVDLSGDEELERNSKSEVVTEPVKTANQNPSASTANEVSYDDELPSAPAGLTVSGVKALPTDDDMRPHTFNLIPASRRYKILRKRPPSPNADADLPAKKFHGFPSPACSSPATSANNVSSIPEGTSQTVTTNAVNDFRDAAIPVCSNDSKSQNSGIPLPETNSVTFPQAASVDLVAKLSLLGNIKVRNLNAKRTVSEADASTKNSLTEITCPKMTQNTDFMLEEPTDNELSDSSSIQSVEVTDNVSLEVTDGASQEDSRTGIKNGLQKNLSEPLIDIESADVIIGDHEESQEGGIRNSHEAVVKSVKMNSQNAIVGTVSKEDSRSTVLLKSKLNKDKSMKLMKNILTLTDQDYIKPNFVIFNLNKKSLKPVSEIVNSMKQINSVGDSINSFQPRIKVLNAQDMPRVPKDGATVDTMDQMLVSDANPVAGNESVLSISNSIAPSLKTGPKYRKPARLKTVARASIPESTPSTQLSWTNSVSTDPKNVTVTVVDSLPTNNSSRSLLKNVKIVSPAVQTFRPKLTQEIEETILSMIEPPPPPPPQPSPPPPAQKLPAMLPTVKCILPVKSDMKSTDVSNLPPVRTEVYELYELLDKKKEVPGQQKKDEASQQRVADTASSQRTSLMDTFSLYDQDLYQMPEKLNSATMIEISSLKEGSIDTEIEIHSEIEIKHSPTEIQRNWSELECKDGSKTNSISDIGSPSCDDSYRFLYEFAAANDKNLETGS